MEIHVGTRGAASFCCRKSEVEVLAATGDDKSHRDLPLSCQMGVEDMADDNDGKDDRRDDGAQGSSGRNMDRGGVSVRSDRMEEGREQDMECTLYAKALFTFDPFLEVSPSSVVLAE